jgi:hypothetical protein
MSLDYGVKLSDIIKVERKSKMKKLVIVLNGSEFNALFCKEINLKIEDDCIKLLVEYDDDATELEDEEQEAIPKVNGILPPSKDEIYILGGDDYESFEALSEFRHDDNIVEKKDNQKLVAITIESDTYNIQDLQSVSNAILDIIAKEQEFLSKGFKVFKNNIPRYSYEDENHFKLVETTVLSEEVVKVQEANTAENK